MVTPVPERVTETISAASDLLEIRGRRSFHIASIKKQGVIATLTVPKANQIKLLRYSQKECEEKETKAWVPTGIPL